MPERLLYSWDKPFFHRQTKIVLENSGRIDPERIEEYIAADGYRALVQVLAEMTPARNSAGGLTRAACAAAAAPAIPPA